MCALEQKKIHAYAYIIIINASHCHVSHTRECMCIMSAYACVSAARLGAPAHQSSIYDATSAEAYSVDHHCVLFHLIRHWCAWRKKNSQLWEKCIWHKCACYTRIYEKILLLMNMIMMIMCMAISRDTHRYRMQIYST